MKHPTLQEERKLWKKGYQRVVGIDEAGRGPLAGPVIACAVIIDWRTFLHRRSVLPNIKDSKQLTEKQREEFYKILTKHPAIEWGIGIVSEKVIDRINILEATKLAMRRAVGKLKEPDFLILDGNFTLPAVALAKAGIKSAIPQKSVIKGDEKVLSCAGASIIAKVTRDRIMKRYHKKYPHYNFAGNKGYPTKYHRAMLNKYGRCGIHRNSFHYAIT